MNLIFRLLKTLLWWLVFPARRGLLDESIVRFRVWPNDLDTNFHMNNGRYLTLMDLGRLDLLLRNGAIRHVMAQKWYPVLASCLIRFRRPLNLFQRFEIRTRIVAARNSGTAVLLTVGGSPQRSSPASRRRCRGARAPPRARAWGAPGAAGAPAFF